MKIYNCHIHIFRDCDVPRKFLGIAQPIIDKAKTWKIVSWILKNANPFTDGDIADRYRRFVQISKLGTQEIIFNECAKFYPKDAAFIVLPMDMAYMGAGNVPRPYNDQLMELRDLSLRNANVIPFIHVDPRRENFLDLAMFYLSAMKFKGVKIYPNLGYFPYDERLYPLYEYCQANNIPVLSHCSPSNPVYYRGDGIADLLKKSRFPNVITKGKNKDLVYQFADPKGWGLVAKDFPNLKICMAHLGSGGYVNSYMNDPLNENNWLKKILDLIATHENIYSDISYTLYDKTTWSLVKVLMADVAIKTRLLFGSDYYMVEVATTEKQFSIDLRAFLGEDNFKQIAETNPIKYLGL